MLGAVVDFMPADMFRRVKIQISTGTERSSTTHTHRFSKKPNKKKHFVPLRSGWERYENYTTPRTPRSRNGSIVAVSLLKFCNKLYSTHFFACLQAWWNVCWWETDDGWSQLDGKSTTLLRGVLLATSHSGDVTRNWSRCALMMVLEVFFFKGAQFNLIRCLLYCESVYISTSEAFRKMFL